MSRPNGDLATIPALRAFPTWPGVCVGLAVTFGLIGLEVTGKTRHPWSDAIGGLMAVTHGIVAFAIFTLLGQALSVAGWERALIGQGRRPPGQDREFQLLDEPSDVAALRLSVEQAAIGLNRSWHGLRHVGQVVTYLVPLFGFAASISTGISGPSPGRPLYLALVESAFLIQLMLGISNATRAVVATWLAPSGTAGNQSEGKGIAVWTAYALAVVVTFLALTSLTRMTPPPPPPPPPPQPTLSPPEPPMVDFGPPPPPEPFGSILSAKLTGDLDLDGEARLELTLDGPAEDRIEVQPRLSPRAGVAGLSLDGPIVIEKAGRTGSLVLKRGIPRAPTGKSRSVKKSVEVTLTLDPPDGIRLAKGLLAGWPMTLTTAEIVAPFRVALGKSGDFRELDARKKETVVVAFRLDRPPGDVRVPLRYKLGGDSDASDFEVVAPSPFFSREGAASLTLRRLPGRRGLGDRKIVVSCEPTALDPVESDPRKATVEVVIPDPKRTFAWKVEVPAAESKLEAKITITATPPTDRAIDVPIQMKVAAVRENKTFRLGSPDDVWSSQECSWTFDFPIPSPRLAFPMEPRPRSASFEAAGLLADCPKPKPVVLPDPGDRKLGGRVLVVLVLTSGVGRAEFDMLDSFLKKAEKDHVKEQLVGGCLFVQTRNHGLVAYDPANRPDRADHFEADTPMTTIVAEWELFRNVRDQIAEDERVNFSRVLLIRDIAEADPARAAVAITRSSLVHSRSTLCWIAPAPVAQAEFAKGLKANLETIEFEATADKTLDRLEESLRTRP